MIADFTNEDRNLICLNCGKKIISPGSAPVTTYSPLITYLTMRARRTDEITLSFERVEEIMDNPLPSEATRNRSWWSNTESSGQGQAWMNAGWRVRDVNLEKGTIIFKKVRVPFTPPPIRTGIRRKPSKTKIARAQAKYKNIERRRSSIHAYRGTEADSNLNQPTKNGCTNRRQNRPPRTTKSEQMLFMEPCM